MSKKTVATLSPVAKAPSGELIMLTYDRSSTRAPSNITAVRHQWNEALKAAYGKQGGFIGTGVYFVRPEPEYPKTKIDSLTPGSVEYETVVSAYKSVYKNWYAKVAEDVELRVNIYAKILASVSEGARNEIEKDPTYEKLDQEQNDPKALWDLLVKRCSVITNSGGQMLARLKAKESFNKFRKEQSMGLSEYYREFKARLSVMETQGCVLDPEEELATLFIQKLDSATYWQYKDLVDSGNCVRPDTVAKAFEKVSEQVLRKSNFMSSKEPAAYTAAAVNDKQKTGKGKKPAGKQSGKPKPKDDEKAEDPDICFDCFKPGHTSRQCTSPDAIRRRELKAAVRQRSEARRRSEETEEADAAFDEEEAEEEYDEDFAAVVMEIEASSKTSRRGFRQKELALAAAKIREAKLKTMQDWEVGLDSMCTHHLFGNKNFLSDMRECKPVRYRGIDGAIKVEKKGSHKVFGEVYYHPGVPNLVSVGQLSSPESKAEGVNIDWENGAFEVSKGDESYLFANDGRNLYTADLSEELPEVAHFSVETVEANERLYTKKQVAAAKRVRVYASTMGAMSRANLLAHVRSRRVEGIDFTAEDVGRAFEIYGPDLQAVRGKTVKKLVSKSAESPIGKVVDSRVVLHVDIMFVCGVAFLVGYAKPLCMLFCNWIKGKSAEAVKEAIEKQEASLTSEGFEVIEVTSDSEGAMKSIEEELKAAGSRVSIHGPGTHSSEVDVKIKQLKNVTRAITVLPFRLPFCVLMYAVMYACSKINMWPNSSLAHGYSPMEVYLGRSVSVERDLGGRRGSGPLPFGSSCEIYEGTDNTIADRTRPAIWLGSKSNSYGTGWFFTLDTEQVVSREQWRPMPMTKGTINLMNRIASKGPSVPKNLRMIYKGVELLDEERDEDESTEQVSEGTRVIAESSTDLPDGITAEPTVIDRGEDDVVDHEGVAADDREADAQLEPADIQPDPVPDPRSGDEEIHLPQEDAERYHQPDERSRESSQVPEAPWFLTGGPVVQRADGGRSIRARRPVVRFDPSAYSAAVINALEESEQLAPQQLPLREKGRLRSLHSHSAFILSVEKALKTMGDRAVMAIEKEFGTMLAKKVFHPELWDRLTPEQKLRVIRSSMFLKEKTLPEPKLKARFVGGGNMQDKSAYSQEETSSPTVSNSAVYMIAAIAAHEGRKVRTMDVGSAYLNADIKRDVWVLIQPSLAKILCKLAPHYKKYLRKDGSLVVKLDKALYGCIESSRLWYEVLRDFLLQLGFIANEKEPCVFNLQRSGHQVTVCIYVDDLKCTSIDGDDLEWLRLELVKKFKEVTYQDGDVHYYLGQKFDYSVPGECKVSMCDYVSDALEEYGTSGFRATPASEDLFKVDVESPLLAEDKRVSFHSRAAKLLYLALRCRPDILPSVSFLTGRVTSPSEEDWRKLDRLLMYLNSTRELGIVLRAENGLQVIAHVDASFAVHESMKSHTGSFITLGTGPINASSKKQSLVTRSSTEAELVGLSDSLPQIIWTREFLIAQGYKAAAAIVYQDNVSTIALTKKGRSTSAKTRHVAIKYFFVKDREDAGEVVVQYMATDKIIADGLTKPLQGDAFRRSRDRLMGYMMTAA